MGGRLKGREPSTVGYVQKFEWKSIQEFVGKEQHSAESQISFETMELSKKSRVAEAF